jgi:DNA repair protein RadC
MNVKLRNDEKIRILNGVDLFEIMARVLRRSHKIDRKKEHFWVVGLDVTQEILFIELISLGTSKTTHSDPMEIFSLALSKKAYQIVLVHNHPSGALRPSESDRTTTHRMVHIGRFLNLPVWDHLIITEVSYYSFLDSGLLDQLEADLSNIPDALTAETMKRETAERNYVITTTNIVIKLHLRKTEKDHISEITGVELEEIDKIIADFENGDIDEP